MSQINIVTAQNVTLKIELANIGDRFLAAIIDVLIKVGLITLFTIGTLIIGRSTGSNFGLGLLVIIVMVFYSLVFEGLMKGQTPGKRAMKIRVSQLDGRQLSFGSILLRWLFRIIDFPMSTWPTIGI